MAIDISEWFDRSERVECPTCGDQGAVQTERARVCFVCGAIWIVEDGKPVSKLATAKRRE